jgi:hypothetical protein
LLDLLKVFFAWRAEMIKNRRGRRVLFLAIFTFAVQDPQRIGLAAALAVITKMTQAAFQKIA